MVTIGRPCKCWATKEKGNSDDFFKAPDGHYYKSEEIYNESRKEIDAYNEVVNLLYVDYLGYEPKQPFSSYGVKEISKLRKFYGAVTILHTFEECKDALEWANMSKHFDTEFSHINYLLAIIKNKIKDVYDREERNRKKMEVAESKVFEVIEDIDVNYDVDPHKAKDISEFLEDN